MNDKLVTEEVVTEEVVTEEVVTEVEAMAYNKPENSVLKDPVTFEAMRIFLELLANDGYECGLTNFLDPPVESVLKILNGALSMGAIDMATAKMYVTIAQITWENSFKAGAEDIAKGVAEVMPPNTDRN